MLGGSDDAGGNDVGADATKGSGVANIRIAHLSPDLGPVDFCWKTTGSTTYSGPVLFHGPSGDMADAGAAADVDGQAVDGGAGADGGPGVDVDANADADADADPDATEDAETYADASGDASSDATPLDGTVTGGPDAGWLSDAGPPPGVGFGEVTSSVRLQPAGTFDIALVDAGSTTCQSPKFVTQVTVDAGKHATLALVGLLSAVGTDADPAQALSILSFTDDGQLDLQNARVRLIHAALGWPGAAGDVAVPALSASLGNMLIAREIEPRHASNMSGSPPVDALGYSTVPPMAYGMSMSFQGIGDASSRAWSTSSVDLGLVAGTLHTGFIVSASQGLVLVWCSDAATAASALPASCEMFDAPAK
jgi:hypothetical protein